MGSPDLSFRLQFQDGVLNKVSHTPPWNIFTVYITPNYDAIEFLAKVTSSSGYIGHQYGTTVKLIENVVHGVEYSFDLNAQTIFPTQGEYNLAFYLHYANDSWSDSIYFKVSINQDSQYYLTNQEQKIIVEDDND